MSPPDPEFELSIHSTGPAATLALGKCMGELLFAGVVLALEGEMGTGKTTLVRGLAQGLGIEGPVTSPTFALMQEHHGRLDLWHFDAWMAAREEAFLEAGGAEIFGGEGVAVVEWAENVTAWLPRPRIRLTLEVLSEECGGARGGASSGVGSGAGFEAGQEVVPPQGRKLSFGLIPGPGERRDLQDRLEGLIGEVYRAAKALPGLVCPLRGPESTLPGPDSC